MTWLLAAQAQARKRTGPRQMTGLMTNRTDDRLASMEDTNRKISHGHRRWNSFTEGHHKTTSTIGHRREITKETRTHGVNNTKTLEHGLHIVVGDFEWKIANEDETDILVSSGNRNRDVPKGERRSLKKIVPIFSSLASHTNLTTLEELHSIDHFSVKGSQQLWGNFGDPKVLLDFLRKMQHHNSSKGHICKTNSTTIQYVPHYLPEKHQVNILGLISAVLRLR